MKKLSTILFLLTITWNGWCAKNTKMVSPNGKLTMEVKGEGFAISWNKQAVLELAQIGMETTATGQGLTLQNISKKQRIKDDYQMLTGKRLLCTN